MNKKQENFEDRKFRDKKEKKNNLISSVLNKISKTTREKLQDLRTQLSELSLEELSSLTQLIDGEVSKYFISINAIVAELMRRSEKNNEQINVEVGGKIVVVSSLMLQKEQEDLVELIRISAEKGDPIKYSIVPTSEYSKYSKSHSSELITDVKRHREGVYKLQQELDRLK